MLNFRSIDEMSPLWCIGQVPQPRKGHAQFFRGVPQRDWRGARTVEASALGAAQKHIRQKKLAAAAMPLVRPDETAAARYQRIGRAAQAAAAKLDDDASWSVLLDVCLRMFNSHPEWPLAQSFLKWTKGHPAISLRALNLLWNGPQGSALRSFGDALPRETFPLPVVRLGLAMMLRTVQNARLIRQIQTGRRTKQTPALAPTRQRPVVSRLLSAPAGDPAAPAVATAAPTAGRAGVSRQHTEPSSTPSNEQPLPAPSPDTHTTGVAVVRTIGLETFGMRGFQVQSEPHIADRERREAALVNRYVAWLQARGVSPVRNMIRPPGCPYPLYTDLYDPSCRQLIEAKASAERDDIRMALGQLLDYARYVPHDSLAVLTPHPVPQELASLLAAHDIRNIYEAHGMFRVRDLSQRRPPV